ncbi:MAG: hypothetical protein RL708_128 [Bacteroidota bacterium]|jgi:hypothetical protein
MTTKGGIKVYLSLIMLFIPPFLFLLATYFNAALFQVNFSTYSFPWQIYILTIAGLIATIGGVLDWRYHRIVLKMKLPEKERKAEAMALGLGGIPMFVLMYFATISNYTKQLLIPIIIVLIYTVVAICYDEFTFHVKRCKPIETLYHRMLVLGNGIAWLAWFHLIYYK